MVLAALTYGIIVSCLIVLVGSRLPGEVARRNEAEAKLRFDLTRLRENAESVALIQGSPDEQRAIHTTYGKLVDRWLTVIQRHARLTWLPIPAGFCARPAAHSGGTEISVRRSDIGRGHAAGRAFVHVQVAIVWLVDNFRALAQCYASIHRVNELDEAMDDIAQAPHGEEAGIHLVETQAGEIRLDQLQITDRDGRCLVDECTLTIQPGEKVIVTGDSGSGKSTLVRALAGLWPWGHGTIDCQKTQRSPLCRSGPICRWAICVMSCSIRLGQLRHR